jgi:hypothetical protein
MTKKKGTRGSHQNEWNYHFKMSFNALLYFFEDKRIYLKKEPPKMRKSVKNLMSEISLCA